MIYILMGVSGSGKTTVGRLLAARLELPFYDGDDFHPSANVQKMASGRPLNDADRRPWLEELAVQSRQWEADKGAVLACSALKREYRKILRSRSGLPLQFIFLKGPKSLIARRMHQRDGHFMPEGLLDSQFKTLEEPERAIVVSIDQTPESIVDQILTKLKSAYRK